MHTHTQHIAPTPPKIGPRVAQERPKSSQERPKSDQERPKSGQERPKGEPELRRWAQERPRRAQDGPGPPKGRPKTPQTPPGTPPNAPQEAPRSLQECEVRPKSFEIVERCRKKSRKQTLEPQVRNPRTKQAARRSTRRKIRRPRVRSSPHDPHEESSASQRKPQEFPNNFRYHRVPHLYNCLEQPERGTSLRGGGGLRPQGVLDKTVFVCSRC